MKYSVFIIKLLICLLTFSCKSRQEVYMLSSFKNNGQDGLHLAYSMDGITWKALQNDSSFLRPEISKDKLMRDPCIIKGKDDKFHMVWTVSWTAKGIGYANSKDLIHWSEQQYIPVMENEPYARNSWAPELFYNDVSDEYMIYWATTITGRFQAGDSSSESGYNHRIYYMVTKDFKKFSETKLLYDKGFSVIDAVIKKYNNKYYMILKDETRFPEPKKYLRITTGDSPTNSWSEPGPSISPAGIWVEGPTSIKIGNVYYIYFDIYRNHKIGAIKSTDLVNWTNISDAVSFPDGTKHGTVFKVSKKVLNKLLRL
jgi:beta-xylosidase